MRRVTARAVDVIGARGNVGRLPSGVTMRADKTTLHEIPRHKSSIVTKPLLYIVATAGERVCDAR